jgi:hypothetical protein
VACAPLFNRSQHLFGVAFRLHIRKDLQECLVGSDYEGGAGNSYHFLPIHVLFFQHPKLIADLFVYICKERVRQLVFLAELVLGFWGVAGDAEDDRPGGLELLEGVAKATGLNGAARGVGLGVKEEYNRLAGKVGKVSDVLLVILEGEVFYFLMQLHAGFLAGGLVRVAGLVNRFMMTMRGGNGSSTTDYSRLGRSLSLRPAGRGLIEHGLLGRNLAAGVFAALFAFGATVLPAQYPGRVTKADQSTPVLRSVAVLEWTGEEGKPTASRLIPVAVFDGAQLNDGTIYLNRPEPLALAGGTEYELQKAGKASQLFDVSSAGEIHGTWLGFGAVKPLSKADAEKAAGAFNTSTMLHGVDVDEDEKPVLKRKHPKGTDTDDASAKSGSGSATDTSTAKPAQSGSGEPTLKRKADDSSSTAASNGSASGKGSDPDQPTLKRKSGDDSSTSSSGTSSTASGTASSGSGKPVGEADPDRPTIRRSRKSNDAGMLETSNAAPDPDRPRLKHGKPADLVNTEETRLTGLPANMQQAVAVSDAGNRAEHPWQYSWADPADETKMKQALEAMARTALGLDPPPAKPAAKTAAARAAAARKKNSMLQAEAPEPVALADEHFRVFELTYGATATLVLTAASPKPDAPDTTDSSGNSSDEPPPPVIKRGKPTQTTQTTQTTPKKKAPAPVQPKPAPQKFVTLVAQPDLYGGVLVLYKSVTDTTHLDDTPRMRLIDAVDAMGDNRGELLFELRGATQRQFALFRVLRGSAEQLFATVALP